MVIICYNNNNFNHLLNCYLMSCVKLSTWYSENWFQNHLSQFSTYMCSILVLLSTIEVNGVIVMVTNKTCYSNWYDWISSPIWSQLFKKVMCSLSIFNGWMNLSTYQMNIKIYSTRRKINIYVIKAETLLVVQGALKTYSV